MSSTSDRALALLMDDALQVPALVVTDQQTAGRGRGVHRWWSAPGGLTLTLIVDLPTHVAAHRRSVASLFTALAIRHVVAQRAPRQLVTVKWPNDVYVDARKACGILLESAAAKPNRLAIGIGLNVNNSFRDAPRELAAIATSLSDRSGREHDMTDLLRELARELVNELSALDQPGESGRGSLSARWAPHCHLTGRTAQIEAGGKRIAGVCRGIDDSGALILDTPEGERRVSSGSVVAFE